MKLKSSFPKNFYTILLITVSLIMLSGQSSVAQEKSEAYYKTQVDLKDVIKKLFGKKSRFSDTLSVIRNPKELSVSILPGISYNPANGAIIGASTSFSKYYGNPSDTKLSAVSASASYTTKKQIKLSVQSTIFSNKNEWSLQGDWRMWKYSQDTYGLGTQTVPSDAEKMKFNFIRLNENVLRKLIPNCYIGLGYSLEYYYSITTIDENDNPIYPNYNSSYSALHQYDSTKYLSSGFVVNLAYDSRDNSINSYKGILADVKYYNYRKFLGSSQDWQYMAYEFRGFKSLTKSDSYILAFWTLGSIGLGGAGPYMSLPAVGWDKYNTTGRGYIQGRFRGSDYVYAEFANRIRLTSNGLLGMVIFVNVESASNKDSGIKLLDYIEPAGGIGLRIKFDKYSRTNICIDFGIGRYGSNGVFLNIGEFF